ncbi:hypothetical protein ACFQ34_07140 [Pseudonocardia benzenivorans]|uniref:DUF11 domain-containing protein n=1 Tax=Pseudonocardia benzenivorans TaxID=228005 RepID=A0ABW3VDA2_9PSEU|nr:hypothetical protein PSD17_60830 [Pseudonocardia sp. D17]
MRHRPPTHRPRRRAAALAGLTATAVVAGLVALTGTASAATTTRVSNDDITAACTTSATLCHDGVATVVDGAGADLGSGFLRLSTPGATDKADVFSRALYGKPLSALTALGYETYIETPGSGDPRQAPSYTIEATGPQGFTSLVWEPVYSGTAVAVGTWQTWNPGAMPGWWASRDVTATGTPNRFGFATYTATFADVVRAMTGYTIIDVGISQGSGSPGLQARADGLTVGDTVYDFDNPVVPTRITATAGDRQTALTGAAFPTPPTVKITGAGGLAAAGRQVTFTVTKGAASFPGGAPSATVTTGDDGVATAPTLTAGRDAGPVTVTATTGPLTATFTETVAAPPGTGAKRADLAVTLAVPATVLPGGTFQAIVTVRNNGPYPATNVATALTMPNGLVVVAAPGGIAPRNGHSVAWLTPQIGSSSQVAHTVTLAADTKVRGPQQVRAATLATSVADPDLLNNAAVTIVTVK